MNGLPMHTETQRFAYAKAVHEEAVLQSIATSKWATIAFEKIKTEVVLRRLGALRK